MVKSYKLLIVILTILLVTLACSTILPSDTNEQVPQPNEAVNENPNQAAEEQALVEEIEEPTEPPTIEDPPPAPPESEYNLEVVTHTSYVAYDILNIDGVLKSLDEIPLDFVRVDFTFLDAEGNMVGENFTYSNIQIVQPGETSPFRIMVAEIPENWESYEIALSAQEPFLDPNYSTDFEIVSSDGSTDDFYDYVIEGEIKNVGSIAADFVQIHAALFDAEGNILAGDFTFSEADVIEPGATSTFSINFLNTPAQGVADYQLWVQGSIVE